MNPFSLDRQFYGPYGITGFVSVTVYLGAEIKSLA